MQKLANFSIETDSVVLLHFQNGQEQRVGTAQLPDYLFEPDLKRVQSAMRLRQDFIKTHLPKMGLFVLVVLGIAALAMGSRQAVAQFWPHQAAPGLAPAHESISHMAVPTTSPVIAEQNPQAKDRVALATSSHPAATAALAATLAKKTINPTRKAFTAQKLVLPAVGDITVTVTPEPVSLPGVKAVPVITDINLPVVNQAVEQTPVVTPQPDPTPTPSITPAQTPSPGSSDAGATQ